MALVDRQSFGRSSLVWRDDFEAGKVFVNWESQVLDHITKPVPLQNCTVMVDLKGAPAVHFNIPLHSFSLYISFKSGIAAASEPIPLEWGGLVNELYRFAIKVGFSLIGLYFYFFDMKKKVQ